MENFLFYQYSTFWKPYLSFPAFCITEIKYVNHEAFMKRASRFSYISSFHIWTLKLDIGGSLYFTF